MASEPLRGPNAIPPRTSSHRQSMLSNSLPQPVVDSLKSSVSPSSHPTKSSILNPLIQDPAESKPQTSEHAGNNASFQGRSSWSPKKEIVLLGPFDYLYEQPGKDIRRQLIAAFNEWLEIPPESVEVITKVVGMLHTASLLVDDIEDSSTLRRGMPVAHSSEWLSISYTLQYENTD